MPIYRVIRKSDGEEVTRYCSAQIVGQINGMDFPQTDYDHVEFVEEVQTLPPQPMRITRLAFRNRFTPQEKAALEIAALDDQNASMEQRALAATLRAYLADVAAAEFIDLRNAVTRAGVMQLEQVGLLAQGRVAQILDTPPMNEELWHGQ